MRLEDYQRKVIDDFQGLYSSGEDDQCPEDHFIDCLNVEYNPGEVRTRSGLSTSVLLGYGTGTGNIKRFFNFFGTSGVPFVLILDDGGNLYLNGSATPLITVAGATDFSALQWFDRVYIAFHNGIYGLENVNLKVFIIATLEIRDAAGFAPAAAGPMVVVDGAAGSIAAGDHLWAVAYETNTGFITPPGPITAVDMFTPTVHTAAGNLKADISSIPTGPTYITKRHILVTRANQTEFFFLPGGTIEDNTTAVLVGADFFDEDLVDSADYLFDLLEEIPAPLGLEDYDGSLVSYGEFGFTAIPRVAKPYDPESFDSIDGLIDTSKDHFGVRNAVCHREVLYLHKEIGVIAVNNNGEVPSDWPQTYIDRVVSTPVHGIAEILELGKVKITRDFHLVIDKSGILVFTGIFRKPPITQKIDNIWKRANFDNEDAYPKFVLILDDKDHKIYCSFCVDDATENNFFLMGDYSGCAGGVPNDEQIKWSVYEFPFNIQCMGMASIVPDVVPSLKLGTIEDNGKLYKLDNTVTSDDGVAIDSFIEQFLPSFDPGNVHFWNTMFARIIGSGDLEITARGLDNSSTYSPPNQSLSLTPGRELMARFNIVSERLKLKLRVNGLL